MQNQEKSKTLFVILKTSERCNLNCSYCYFFNSGDESYKHHPAFIQKNTILNMVKFLKDGVQDLAISRLYIAYHGGEPLLQPISQFRFLCETLIKNLSDYVDLEIHMQTNGTLINSKWIQAFEDYNVHIGVSLDGPEKDNDVFRVDHKGKGSHYLVKKGISLLNKASLDKRINEIGILCVINPQRSSQLIYRHFLDDLKVKRMDFLFPDFTYDTFDFTSLKSYEKYVLSLLGEWIKDNDPSIRMRFFESILNTMVGKSPTLSSIGNDQSYALTISSNGELSPDDSLRSINSGNLMQNIYLSETTLKKYFNSSIFHTLENSKNNLPSSCMKCCWKNICHGGFYVNRYSQENGFNNPSIFCEVLKKIYSNCSSFLIKNGFPLEKLQTCLSV